MRYRVTPLLMAATPLPGSSNYSPAICPKCQYALPPVETLTAAATFKWGGGLPYSAPGITMRR